MNDDPIVNYFFIYSIILLFDYSIIPLFDYFFIPVFHRSSLHNPVSRASFQEL